MTCQAENRYRKGTCSKGAVYVAYLQGEPNGKALCRQHLRVLKAARLVVNYRMLFNPAERMA